VAFIFGSMAKATEGPQSDVDLMVIGEVTFGQVANAVYDAQLALAREINPKVMSREEWSDKKNAHNVFVQELMDKPKIFIVGSEHEL
jgi:predicted nucleotidyltransferase